MENDAPATKYTVPVAEDKAGERLDRLLAGALPDLSRTRVKALLEDGHVLLRSAGADPRPAGDASRKVRAGEVYEVTVPAVAPAVPVAQAIDLDVLFEDDDVIVINKPPGLVVHPAAGNPDRTLVNALLHHCAGSLSGIGGVGRPGIVHRLDKDTSGLMVAAKNDLAHHSLTEQFAARSIERSYQAVVWGLPSPRKGDIEGNIGRSPVNRKKMAVLPRGGKHALTRYAVIRALGSRAALVECRLATGRTHQIRVHMTESGHPLVGDPLYGGGQGRRLRDVPEPRKSEIARFGRQALHANLIGFLHPRTGEKVRYEIELPSDINMLICALEAI